MEDLDMEEGEEEQGSSSSGRNEASVGTRRPREDDSDASSSKRSRSGSDRPLADAGALSTPRGGGDDDSTPSAVVTSRTKPVRDPWMPSPSEIQSRYGSTTPASPYALYSCSAIVDDDVTKELDFDPATDQRRDYYIGLFHELRFYGNKKHSRKSKVTEWEALCQSWGGSRSVKSDAVVSTISVDTQVQHEEPVTNKDSDSDASAQGADAIGPNVERRSAVRRRGKEGAPALGADAAGSADGCKRPAPEMLACSRAAGLHDEAVRDQAGLDCVRPREEPAGDNKKRIACSRAAGLHEEAMRDQAGLDGVRPRVEPAGDQKEDLSATGPGQDKTRGTGFRTRSERRKRAKLRKSRSGTEALLAVSAGQTQELETTVETLSVLTRTNTGLQYKKMKLENSPTLASELTSLPVTSWRRFARDLHDGRIEQICILSDVERMKCEAEELKQLVAEGVDALSAKSKKERFDEQSWDS
ncbi:hypothetical protein PR001_g30935, partial [Phytophthora rubi]